MKEEVLIDQRAVYLRGGTGRGVKPKLRSGRGKRWSLEKVSIRGGNYVLVVGTTEVRLLSSM